MMPLPWLQPVKTPQNHPSVAIPDSLPVATKSPPHTLFAAFLVYYAENQYSYNKPSSHKYANKGSQTRQKMHFLPSFLHLNPNQPTKKNVKLDAILTFFVFQFDTNVVFGPFRPPPDATEKSHRKSPVRGVRHSHSNHQPNPTQKGRRSP